MCEEVDLKQIFFSPEKASQPGIFSCDIILRACI